jgi:hypothetical protein
LASVFKFMSGGETEIPFPENDIVDSGTTFDTIYPQGDSCPRLDSIVAALEALQRLGKLRDRNRKERPHT